MLGDSSKFKSYCTHGVAGNTCRALTNLLLSVFRSKRLSSQIKRCLLLPPAKCAASPRHLTNPPLALISLHASRLESVWRGKGSEGNLGLNSWLGMGAALRPWALRPRSSPVRVLGPQVLPWASPPTLCVSVHEPLQLCQGFFLSAVGWE